MKIYVILNIVGDEGSSCAKVESAYLSEDDAFRHLKCLFEKAKDVCKKHNEEYAEIGFSNDWECPEYDDGERWLDLSEMSSYETNVYHLEECELRSNFDERMVSLEDHK